MAGLDTAARAQPVFAQRLSAECLAENKSAFRQFNALRGARMSRKFSP